MLQTTKKQIENNFFMGLGLKKMFHIIVYVLGKV